MAREIAPRELGQRVLARDRRGTPDPVLDQHVGMLSADHRPAHDVPKQGGAHEHVHVRLAFGAHAGGGDALAELHAGERPLLGEGIHRHLHAALHRGLGETFVGEPAPVARERAGGGERLQPPG